MNIIDFVLSLKKGVFGNKVITMTEPKLLKRGNPLIGQDIKKITFYSNIGLGISYENTINNRKERNGEERDFEAEKPFGMSWEHFPFILKSDKNPSQKYLRLQFYANTKVKSVFLINGKLATPNELEVIKQFTPKKTETEIKVVSVKLENIKKIKQANLSAKF
jgi:hypothetical protein